MTMTQTLAQGSDEWHRWRQEGLGSSDAPVVMGISPWKSRTQLWREKTTGDVEERCTAAMQRGIDLEPKARAWAGQELGQKFEPVCFQSRDRPWLRASLDGITSKGDVAIEIKCPGEQDHASALRGQVPQKYQWQLIHQMLCTGLDEIYYVSYSPNPDAKSPGVILKFAASQDQRNMLKSELDSFWRCCQELLPPEEGARDGILIDDEKWLQCARDYADIEAEIAGLELRKKQLREMLCDPLGEHRRIIGGGLVITRQPRQGPIDYTRIPQLQGADLEPFRKEGTYTTHIRLAKSKP